ncbi:hypothetical protein Tco_1013422 [Tanacetum coccineum]
MSENEDKYHDTVLDLKEKFKMNVDTVLKIGNSIQGMLMIGPKPMSFYDSQVKHGLGYANPYTLKKAISQNPKLYDASCLDDSKIHMNVRDTEDILEDATKSQIKMKNKMKDPIVIQKKQNVSTIDYKKLNALYEDFVPQRELSAEQKYFSSSLISHADPSNESLPYSSSETKPTKQQMPSTNPILVNLNEMENDFQKLFKLLQTASKRESIFYTSPEEIRLNDFFQQQLKPILQELNDTWKQIDLLQNQLLEATLKHEIECCVLLNHEFVDNNMQDEIEKVQRDSIETQEVMQICINILENDVQSKGKGLFGPNDGRGRKVEVGFNNFRGGGQEVGNCSGNGGIGSSIFRREVGGVENKSSIGLMLMAKGDECLDGWVGADGGEVKGGGVDFGVTKRLLGDIPMENTGESGGEEFRVDEGAV